MRFINSLAMLMCLVFNSIHGRTYLLEMDNGNDKVSSDVVHDDPVQESVKGNIHDNGGKKAKRKFLW